MPDSIQHDSLKVTHAWLRRLAQELTADPHTADDLVQEAWVAALEQPTAPTRSQPSWLAGVLRNVARQRTGSS